MRFTEPVLPPKHRTFVTVFEPLNVDAGCVIVTLAFAVQLLASVTVTVYAPGIRPVAVAVVCTGNVFH